MKRCNFAEKHSPQMDTAEDIKYMKRALMLARRGEGFVSPNPMVGAVITARGRIIGEGYHRQFGGPHAEVNAVRSVAEADRHLLAEATIYVTLEPCSHYGKTPPCARLLIDTGVKRIVGACTDPNPKVAGRGYGMLREAGREVVEGVLEAEALHLNRRFMTAQTLRRPWIQLKWAESADGFMGSFDASGNPRPVMLSTPLTSVLMHRERAAADAIMIGSGTALSDNPSLTLRLWPGRQPLKAVLDRSGRVPADAPVLSGRALRIDGSEPLPELLSRLFAEEGVSSLMVEGGPAVLHSFIDAGLWDEIRRERSPLLLGNGPKAPEMPRCAVAEDRVVAGQNIIETFVRPSVKKN